MSRRLGFLWLLAALALPVQAQTTVEYIHTDALGSPVAVTDASRNVIERSEYEPFGEVLVPSAPQDGPGYTGHVFDSATGLNYMQQRYYDPGIGRFLSVDPVTAYENPVGAFNRYWYANNNPYRFTDPDGRQACEGEKNCLEASNYKPEKAGNQTVVQSTDVDMAVTAATNMPNFETTGVKENALRVDESQDGVKITPVKTTTVSNNGVIEGTIEGVGGSSAVIHSHSQDLSDSSPGPGDDAAVNAGYPNNVVRNGNAVVVEKVNGQFRARILRDKDLTPNDKKEIRQDLRDFQKRSQ